MALKSALHNKIHVMLVIVVTIETPRFGLQIRRPIEGTGWRSRNMEEIGLGNNVKSVKTCFVVLHFSKLGGRHKGMSCCDRARPFP